MTEPLICELSVPGRHGVRFPEPDVPLAELPEGLLREDLPLPGAFRSGCRPPLHPPVQAELLHRPGHLPARLVHDEIQPQDQRRDRPPARLCRHSTRSSRSRPCRATCR